MSDLENMPEITEETTQPVEPVVGNTEAAEASPQADDTELEEFVVESEGDDNEPKEDTDNEEARRRAAFAKRKKSEKAAKEKAKLEGERADRLEKELSDLKSRLDKSDKGPRPDPMDYSDTDTFYSDLDKWNGVSSTASQPAATAQEGVKQAEADYAAEYKFEEGSEKLKKGGVKDFDEKISLVKSSLADMGCDPEAAFNYLMSIAASADVDPSKAGYMIGLNPVKLLNEINSINSGNVAADSIKIAKVMEREAKKLKTRKKSSVNTSPEPNVSSGAVKRSNSMEKFGSFD